MDKLKAMESFIVAAQAENFAAAARKLGLSRAMVSRQISDLETLLGVRLFNRTTRDVGLTGVGEHYLGVCSQLVNSLAEEEAKLTDLQNANHGFLRIVSARSFGEIHMGRAIADFQMLHPDLQIQMVLAAGTKSPLQLYETGFDLGVCIAHSPTLSSVLNKIADFEWILCASPKYLSDSGPIDVLDKLSDERVLVNPIQTPHNTWNFIQGEKNYNVKIKPAISITNYVALREIVLEGAGVSVLPSFCVREDLDSGRLVRILSDYSMPPSNIIAVYPHHKYVTQKVKTFTAFIKNRFKGSF